MVATSASAESDIRLDLREARVLSADANSQGLDILAQMLMGFGVQHNTRVQSEAEFRHALESTAYDLILIDSTLEGNGYELVRKLRISGREPNRFTPVVVLSGHTPRSQVEQARDCGCNFVVAKPLNAGVLLDRIIWVGRNTRLFVDAETYAGPDRRFKNDGVPDGQVGRRKGDLSAEVGEARDPNMSQSQIDGLLKPRKLTI
jgi:CheY-like chemotaxis protein